MAKATLTIGKLQESLQNLLKKQGINKDTRIYVESDLEESFESLKSVEIVKEGDELPYVKGDLPEEFGDEENATFICIKLMT